MLVEFWEEVGEVFFEFFEVVLGVILEEWYCCVVSGSDGDGVEFYFTMGEWGSCCQDLDSEQGG